MMKRGDQELEQLKPTILQFVQGMVIGDQQPLRVLAGNDWQNIKDVSGVGQAMKRRVGEFPGLIAIEVKDVKNQRNHIEYRRV
jgi:hypothetical protein